MNILLLTNCVVQPDDIDKSVNNIVFSFAREWVNEKHRVIIVNNESNFFYLFYKAPECIIKFMKSRGNFTVPSMASRNRLEWEVEGVKLIRLPMFKLYPHASFFNRQYKNQKKEIVQFLEYNDFIPDVVTGHWMEPQLQLVNLIGDYYHSKKALVVHGELPTDLTANYKRLIQQLDVLFFRSQSVKKRMLEKYDGDFLVPQKTSVCFSGIPDQFVATQCKRIDWKRNGLLKIVYVGRLERYKRIDAIIDALDIAFPKLNFQFDIIGDGPEKENIHIKVKRLHLIQNVNFLGRISRTEVIEHLMHSDCFVMISENEVFGLVYLESMACGCMTIAAKDGGVDGIIEDSKNGFLCRQGDFLELSNILKNINNMQINDVEKVRKEAYKTVENYTERKAAKYYLDRIIEK